MESALIDLNDHEHFKVMFRNKLYFYYNKKLLNYCICILNYMYNFSNDWFFQ